MDAEQEETPKKVVLTAAIVEVGNGDAREALCMVFSLKIWMGNKGLSFLFFSGMVSSEQGTPGGANSAAQAHAETVQEKRLTVAWPRVPGCGRPAAPQRKRLESGVCCPELWVSMEETGREYPGFLPLPLGGCAFPSSCSPPSLPGVPRGGQTQPPGEGLSWGRGKQLAGAQAAGGGPAPAVRDGSQEAAGGRC